MEPASWSAIAAWVSLFLSSATLLLAVLNQRPATWLSLPSPTKFESTTPNGTLRIGIRSGPNAVLIRSVRLISRRKDIDLSTRMDGDNFRGGILSVFNWQQYKRFQMVVAANTTDFIEVSKLPEDPWMLFVIRWKDFRLQPFPWSILLLTPRLYRDLRHAAEIDLPER